MHIMHLCLFVCVKFLFRGVYVFFLIFMRQCWKIIKYLEINSFLLKAFFRPILNKNLFFFNKLFVFYYYTEVWFGANE